MTKMTIDNAYRLIKALKDKIPDEIPTTSNVVFVTYNDGTFTIVIDTMVIGSYGNIYIEIDKKDKEMCIYCDGSTFAIIDLI